MAISEALRLLALVSLPATAVAQALRGSSSWDWRCSNVCYPKLGFWHSDCHCEAHSTWYVWVCPTFQGTPVETQYCGMHNCGGCYAVDVEPSSNAPQAPAQLPQQGADYHPLDGRLLQPSLAPKLTYYMYRVQSDADYAPENQNMANLAGALWYLHNEIVTERHQRRYQKTRIQRFKVTTQPTQPMFEDGMEWGVRFAFDSGHCSGPWDCQDAFQRYGYFVGCNSADEFPTGQWKNKIFYPNAVWYSLAGKCNSRHYWEHTDECELEEPGGACDDVNGMGNCTYSYTQAGEISLDELEGIEDFKAFVDAGGWEYNNQTDMGVHMTFWDDKYNASACEDRMEQVKDMFRTKYEGEPFDEELSEPTCGFRYSDFYRFVPQEEATRTVTETQTGTQTTTTGSQSEEPAGQAAAELATTTAQRAVAPARVQPVEEPTTEGAASSPEQRPKVGVAARQPAHSQGRTAAEEPEVSNTALPAALAFDFESEAEIRDGPEADPQDLFVTASALAGKPHRALWTLAATLSCLAAWQARPV